MKLKDRIWAWFLFAQDTLVTILLLLAVCLAFFALEYAEDKEFPIDYEQYPSRTEVLEVACRNLYTVEEGQLLFNGREVKYTYMVDGIEYVNILFFKDYSYGDIIRLIHEGKERGIQVCYRLDNSEKSVLKVKEGLVVP